MKEDNNIQIDPMLLEFLDSRTNVEKIRILNKYRDFWSANLLKVMETSLDLVASDSDDVSEHYKYLLKVLEMKKRYEEPHIR